MQYITIHSIEQYQQYKASLAQFVPVVVSANYIFAGPVSGYTSKEACFACFLQSLKDNESFYYDIIESAFATENGYFITDELLAYVKTFEGEIGRFVAVVNSRDLGTRLFPVHFSPLCTEYLPETGQFFENLNWDYRFCPGKRIKSGGDIFSDKNKARLFHMHSGIGKKLMRDADAKIIPMFYVKSQVMGSRYYSYGRADTYQKSQISAGFEMLERYASIVPHVKPGLTGSYLALKKQGEPVINPKELTLNATAEENGLKTGFVPYSEDAVYRWMKVMDLADGSFAYMPEQVLYYDSQLVSGEERFIYETSNGCALGGSPEEAAVYALLEVIERDAFLMHWYNRIAPVNLNIRGIKNRNLINVVNYMEQLGYKIKIFDITMESGIPAVWAAAVDETHHGRVKCYNAAGAHPNPEKALEAALAEVVTSIHVYDKIIAGGTVDEKLKMLAGNPDGVRSMEDHVYFYSIYENFDYIKPYYENTEEVDFCRRFADWYRNEEQTCYLTEFVDKIRRCHKHIYLGYLESPITRELDLYCVKAVVPSMLTMTFGVQNQRINPERIRQGAVAAGIRRKPIAAEEINKTPHPFP
ncbi:MAG: YcaO-like family protein [Lachnospiraceae bacterium]|nr:YcaO-like family protein [Lachnospiraceae bacterium]